MTEGEDDPTNSTRWALAASTLPLPHLCGDGRGAKTLSQMNFLPTSSRAGKGEDKEGKSPSAPTLRSPTGENGPGCYS